MVSLALTGHAAEIAEKVTAELQPKNGSQVSGQFDFFQTASGVDVKYKIKNLRRNKNYQINLHEKPDCSSVDAKSAGNTYAGDLPMVKSNKAGTAEGEFSATQLSISGNTSGTYSLIDRAIVVHSGTRIACGIIKSTVK